LLARQHDGRLRLLRQRVSVQTRYDGSVLLPWFGCFELS
jgi:hypothetical protein